MKCKANHGNCSEYCTLCEKACCSICSVKEHGNHSNSVEPIDQIISNMKQKLEMLVCESKKRVPNLNQRKQKLATLRKQISKVKFYFARE